jgi:hypothetical protein
MLREREAIGQVPRRSVRAKTTLMVFPQRLDLGAELVALGDDVRVAVIADDASRELVRGIWHPRPTCREGAYGIL